MEYKKLTGIIAGLCVIIAAGVAALYFNQDHEAPKFSFSSPLPVYEQEDQGVLLSNITARDNKDGDVTKNIKVESVVLLGDGKARVTYLVNDSSNNIAYASQVVSTTLERGEEIETTSADSTVESTTAEEIIVTPTETTEEKESPSETTEDSAADGRPKIILNKTTATLAVGQPFVYYTYISHCEDDKDSAAELSRLIHLEGDTSTATPGTREIRYYVSDTDGNRSDAAILTLTVQ